MQPKLELTPFWLGCGEGALALLTLGKDACPAQREEGGGLPLSSFQVQRVCVGEGGSRELGCSLALCWGAAGGRYLSHLCPQTLPCTKAWGA